MSEYKTYKCDICGEHDAQHLYIPDVDYRDEPNEKREWLKGYFDTCPEHMQDVINILCDAIGSVNKRSCWRDILNLKDNYI